MSEIRGGTEDSRNVHQRMCECRFLPQWLNPPPFLVLYRYLCSKSYGCGRERNENPSYNKAPERKREIGQIRNSAYTDRGL
jgi:hypothetical protein